MSDPTPPPAEPAVPEAAAAAVDAAQPVSPAADASALSEADQLRLQVVELKERLVRQQADFDNTRKRLRREADEAGTRAIARSVKPVLDAIDDFARALEAARPDAFAEFAQGVTMIREKLVNALTQSGLEPVPVEGVFDPAVHEVIAEVEQDGVPRGTIVTVHRAGYRLREQLVRAAQVIVAKPPVKPA